MLARCSGAALIGLEASAVAVEVDIAPGLPGLLMVGLSTFHYFGVRNDIEEDTYEPPDRWVVLSSLVLIALGSCVVFYVFQVPFDASVSLLVD